ncbi:MAG: hypothetical protein GY778_02065, partial [bacterium]|nr:hypothetical protein [bacterium]
MTIVGLSGIIGFAATPARADYRSATTLRAYNVDLPGVAFDTSATGKVEAWATAVCGHGSAEDRPPSPEGHYIHLFRNPPNPPQGVATDLSVAAGWVQVPHARAYASQSISPHVTIDGNTARIEVTVSFATNTQSEKCDDGTSTAAAYTKAKVDPIVFGSAPYTSYTGQTLDPFLTRFDGTHRYVEQELSLLGGMTLGEARPGQSPDTMPDGTRLQNGLGSRQYVRAGSDDDPDNESGTLMYELAITIGPDGDPVVQWSPGTDTGQFAFSFNRTAAEIEQSVDDALVTGSLADIPVVTARVTLLQDETTLPNITLIGIDQLDAWSWNSGDPDSLNWAAAWWQGPDEWGTGRHSSLVSFPIRADDFLCSSPNAVHAVRWWGTYANEPWSHRGNAGFSLPFAVHFYNSDGVPPPNNLPLPGPPLSSHNVFADRFFVDWLPSGDALYEFSARLCTPFAQQPGVEYWLSIADLLDPWWAWCEAVSTNMGPPSLSWAPMGPWAPDLPPDLAYALLAPNAVSDVDCDGDVDLGDYSMFFDCHEGPNLAPNPPLPMTPQTCLDAFDADRDGHVDLLDAGEIQDDFTGRLTHARG